MSSEDEDVAGLQSAGKRWADRVVPAFVRRRYLFKFALVLLLMGVAVGAIGGAGTVWLTNEMESNVMDDQATLADSESSNLEGWLERHEGHVELIARDETIQSGDTARMQTEIFDGLESEIPLEVTAIHYLDLESETIRASTNESRVGSDLAALGIPNGSEIERRATQKLSWRSDPYVADVGMETVPAMTFARVVRTNPEKVILYTIPLEPASSEFQTAEDEDATTLVIDGQDRLVLDDEVYGGEQNTFGTQFRHAGTLESYQNLVFPTADRTTGAPVADEFTDVYGFNSEEHIVGYTRVSGSDWILLIYKPADQELGFVRTVQLFGAIGTILAIAVVTILGILLGERTIRSINQLSNRAQTVAAGEFDVDLQSERTDEIGDLYEAFADMRDAIQTRIDELEEARQAEEDMRRELEASSEEIEQQRLVISVLNRMLRHNLRNSLTKILLLLEMVDGESPMDGEESISKIEAEIEQLRRQAEKSRALEDIFQSQRGDLSIIDLAPAIEQIVETYSDTYPDAVIDTEVTENSYVRGGQGVSFVIENLVENALAHNDRSEPTVWISVSSEPVTEEETQIPDAVDAAPPSDVDGTPSGASEFVEITVADDGPGIPDIELEVLAENQETPLKHGSGLGLWLIDWLVDHLDGELTFEAREPRGTIVRVRLPREPP